MCPSQADEAAIQPDPRVRAPQRGELLGRGPQGQEDGEQDQTEQVSHNISLQQSHSQKVIFKDPKYLLFKKAITNDVCVVINLPSLFRKCQQNQVFFKSDSRHPYCKNKCEDVTMCGEVRGVALCSTLFHLKYCRSKSLRSIWTCAACVTPSGRTAAWRGPRRRGPASSARTSCSTSPPWRPSGARRG